MEAWGSESGSSPQEKKTEKTVLSLANLESLSNYHFQGASGISMNCMLEDIIREGGHQQREIGFTTKLQPLVRIQSAILIPCEFKPQQVWGHSFTLLEDKLLMLGQRHFPLYG